MKSSEKPSELFQIAPNLYMQTRNAKEVTEMLPGENNQTSTGWVCECRKVTESEVKLLNQIIELESHATDVDLALAELAGMIGGE